MPLRHSEDDEDLSELKVTFNHAHTLRYRNSSMGKMPQNISPRFGCAQSKYTWNGSHTSMDSCFGLIRIISMALVSRSTRFHMACEEQRFRETCSPLE